MKLPPFDNQYVGLGEAFYSRTRPAGFRKPGLVIYNDKLGESLGLPETELDARNAAEVFSGNRIPAGADPIAMAYTGHQFGHFNPRLGDGRALLMGQIRDPENILYDIHLKGSGQTVFSRNGDGRSALGPVLREYLVSEAMAKLGVPTTRALAAVTTGEEVLRDKSVPGGVITRVARSFVRVGTFEYFASRRDIDSIALLADYVIKHNYPECLGKKNRYLALLDMVIDRQASLIAKWMQLGFIHGVMNTDNMSIAGETIDYGPCAFMDHYAHDKVFSSIDHHGRYAYNNQPSIGLWNLTRFAETLAPLIDEDSDAAVESAESSLKEFPGLFRGYWLDGMRRKVGLASSENRDADLVEELLNTMANAGSDFTLTFHYLSHLPLHIGPHDGKIRELFDHSDRFDAWIQKWRTRLEREKIGDTKRQLIMQSVNPVYIPRNHQIETAIRSAEDHNDFSVFHDLHAVLEKPYARQPEKQVYMLPPEPHEVVEKTFCGT